MWNNFLAEIVKYLTSWDVKWNSPFTFAKQIFHSEAISLGRCQISLAEGEFRWKKRASLTTCSFFLEAPPGFEPGRKGFADLCLTTWLWCLIWSGLRGSNPPPQPWQGCALPNELNPHMVPPIGIEPTTRGFSVPCSTNWATEANLVINKMATRMGLEPTTSSVTG